MSAEVDRSFVLIPGEGRGAASGAWSTRLTGSDTGGLVAIGEADMPPMTAGPALHVHTREDEIAIVIEGTLTVQLGDRRLQVPAGGIAFLARGVPHTFANLTGARVRVIGLIAPGGFEAMFEEIGDYMRTLSGAPDPDRIAAINARYGVTQIGPPIDVATS